MNWRNNITLRTFRNGDEESFLNLVNTAYRNLESLTVERVTKLMSPPYFNPEGFFIAEKKNLPIGCIAVFNLPSKRHVSLQYLAVRKAFSNLRVIDGLTKAALRYSASKKPDRVKAVTPAIQPYVDAYQRFDFKPIRRILRIAWDTERTLKEAHRDSKIHITEVCQDDLNEASCVFVEGLMPYWNWYIEEEGGDEAFRSKVASWMRETRYLAAKVNNKIAGVTAVIPKLESDVAAFSGVMVLPNLRKKGIGSALMSAALDEARKIGCRRMVVHTLAYLDALAPGAVLYLKSGGKIEAEYLQLVRPS